MSRVTDIWQGLMYEDLEIGDVFECGAVTVTESHIVAACGLFGDLAPLHRDEMSARRAGFPGRIAPGVLTAGLIVGSLALISRNGVATHLADNITYKQPVFADDTLTIRAIVTSKEPRSRFGLVWYAASATKQTGESAAEVDILLGHKYGPVAQGQ